LKTSILGSGIIRVSGRILSTWVVATLFLRCGQAPTSEGQQLIGQHPSYARFINSLVAGTLVDFSGGPCVSRSDTIWLANDQCRLDSWAGQIRHVAQFWGYKNPEKYLINYYDSCLNYFQLGSRRFQCPTPCAMELTCLGNGEITFGNTKFVYSIGEPSPNCVGSACRVRFFPTFAITPSDTSFYLFVNADDVTGLRYDDFNRDGNLDWLTVGHGFSRADEEILIKKGLKINELTCENSQCYKITAVTFSQGQWSPFMDAHQQEYYFLVRLAEPLDPDSGFTILAYYWPA
jgi:hypothetical protein